MRGKKHFQSGLDQHFMQKRRKSCDKQRKDWSSLFTQIQITIISNLRCEKQALIHVHFAFVSLCLKCAPICLIIWFFFLC